MSKQPQNTQDSKRTDLKTLGAMPLKEALPIIMEQYQVDEDQAFLLWTGNRPPNIHSDIVTLPPDEFKEYVEESKRNSLGGFTMGGGTQED
jgi:hypothetical protein